MQIVPFPTLSPAQCLLTRKGGVPCVDLGNDFDFDHQGRMYLAVSACRDLGRLVGLVDPEGDLVKNLQAAHDRITELEEQLESEARFREALDVIESADFRARKKAGKPAAKRVPVA